MWFPSTAVAATAALLLSSSVQADDLYLKSSPILQLNAQTYDKHIKYSNHTAIVEFYAPWCGHCQRLKQPYEKAAKNLKGLAKVAGVNCDQDKNKAFCGQMGVKGFPTLKIIRPSKRGGAPIVEDYNGERTTKAIVNAVIEKIPNHVKRVTETSMDNWLSEKNETAKAILFTDKGTVSALWRALAIDYLSVVNFGQIRNKEKKLVEMLGVESFPTFVLLPGGDKEAVKYEGEMKKEGMLEFLTQHIGEPNPDPPKGKPKPPKDASKKGKKKDKAEKAKKTKEEKKEKEKKADTAEKEPETKKDGDQILEKNLTEEELRKKCLSPTSGICALVILPPLSLDSLPEEITETLNTITDIYAKHVYRHGTATGRLQFHVLDNILELSQDLRAKLGLKPKTLEIVALNAKRGWFRRYPKKTYGYEDLDAWVDGIKLDQGEKEELPDALIAEVEEKVRGRDEL